MQQQNHVETALLPGGVLTATVVRQRSKTHAHLVQRKFLIVVGVTTIAAPGPDCSFTLQPLNPWN
jgi:hypothetical protein